MHPVIRVCARTRNLCPVAILAGAAVLTTLTSPPAFAQGGFNTDGNILIADQFNNRVIEVNPVTHAVVWQFGTGSDIPAWNTVVAPNDAQRVGPFTLISGTGDPASTPPVAGCSSVNGCPDNRVFMVDSQGTIIWQYGKPGVTGSGPDQLNTPVQATFVSNFPNHFGFHVLITDQGNQRVILADPNHGIVWQYGTTGVAGNGPNQLSNPNSAEFLENGHVLIADESNNRVIEVTTKDEIVKTFTAGGTVVAAAFASRLPNGDTLISDSGNNRAVEVNANDAIVWQYVTNTQPGSNASPAPTRAVRLLNGNTLISDQFNDRVIEVTKAGHIVFQQGKINVPGSGSNRLNGPYDAKAIGDYTGLTPPFGLF
jgi:hypothetical protein